MDVNSCVLDGRSGWLPGSRLLWGQGRKTGRLLEELGDMPFLED